MLSQRVCWRGRGACLGHSEKSISIVESAIAQDVPGGLGQLASERFGGDDRVAFGQLASMPAFGPLIITANHVGRFNKGPGQVAITTLAVVVGFLLAVAGFMAATVRQ